MLRMTFLAAIFASTAQIVQADIPKIVTDIAPVHGLVSMVTGDLAQPDLLIEPAASPHTNAMRPSAAAALQDADVVFWIGDALSPWLQGPLNTLAEDATQIALLGLPETQTMPFRDTDAFGAHDHEHAHDHDHGDTATDPHAWLDPANAQVWLSQISDTLSQLDPDNAETYAANATAANAAIAQEIEAAQTLLAPVQDQPFVVFHDAYHYFEARFGLEASGALSLSDAVPPSPSRVADIQTDIREQGVVCVFSEPQFSAGLVRTVIDGTQARTQELDPLGVNIALGADFYPNLIRDMANRFSECLQ
ncbi:zinc ABC transporter substrate-binding protein [Marivita sp. S0852]|uniref:zinc ABC transporter substrate-binding protein n=1 Tax=Marivita sp. S0852 TaxID=3373893 RepID=UPI003982BB3E